MIMMMMMMFRKSPVIKGPVLGSYRPVSGCHTAGSRSSMVFILRCGAVRGVGDNREKT